MVASASISSVTRITPSCAVIAEPERPATRMATSTGPSSRMMPRPRILTMKMSAPNWRELQRRQIGQHDADQEADQRGHRHRQHAALVDIGGNLALRQVGRMAQQVQDIEHQLPQQGDEGFHVAHDTQRDRTQSDQAFEGRRRHGHWRRLAIGGGDAFEDAQMLGARSATLRASCVPRHATAGAHRTNPAPRSPCSSSLPCHQPRASGSASPAGHFRPQRTQGPAPAQGQFEPTGRIACRE